MIDKLYDGKLIGQVYVEGDIGGSKRGMKSRLIKLKKPMKAAIWGQNGFVDTDLILVTRLKENGRWNTINKNNLVTDHRFLAELFQEWDDMKVIKNTIPKKYIDAAIKQATADNI